MKKGINSRAVEIQKRFFEALKYIMESQKLTDLKTFCNKNNLNRVRYSRLKNLYGDARGTNTYKKIDIDALAAICEDYCISTQWLLLGRGKMINSKRECKSKDE